MKSLLVLIILISSSAVFAAPKSKKEKTVVEKDMSLLGRIDETSLKIEPVKPVEMQPASESKFSMSCKDQAGKNFKQGEEGYDACLAGMRAQHDLNRTHPGVNAKADAKDQGNSASFNYKIGD